LVEQVVGAGEQWLTELDTDQLRNLLLAVIALERDQNGLIATLKIKKSRIKVLGATVARFA